MAWQFCICTLCLFNKFQDPEQTLLHFHGIQQGHWQSAADHLIVQFKQLQQRQHHLDEAKAANKHITMDAEKQQEQVQQAEHMWNGLQVGQF